MFTKRLEIIVTGLVQGINFRYYTREKAQQMDLVGWVRNEGDGTVKIVAEGEEKDLEKLINWIKSGPQFARVENVKIDWQKSTGEFNKFEIEY